ncbi:pitrilysin family protein [Emcibacter sp. SYSU 3D8]|uniref:M16 family metallopeptidase n=1 Tax=Emcibacter sp. SYSU 3D8 TaxID=3133969 RepID=UPI0031FE74CB
MTRLLAALVLVFTFAARADAVEIREVVSPGGIKAWLVEQHSIPLVAMSYEFEGGVSADPDGKSGLAYLVSGLLNEGAGDLDSLAFQKALDERAIRMSFDADRDQFSGSMVTLTEERSEAFRLLGLALSQPRFDADAVERVRDQVRSIQRSEDDQPRSIAAKAWMRAAFPGHPYANNTTGTPESLASLTAADLRAYVTDNFTRDRLIVGVVGDITPAELGPLLDSTFGALPATGAELTVPDTALAEAKTQVIERQVPQSVAVFGMPGIKRDDPDWYAAMVMNQIFGSGGFSSRLMEEVRRKRGLTYGVYTYLQPYSHAGLVLGTVATVNARMGESKQVIEDEITRMAQSGATEAEVADAKTYLTGSYALNFDTSGAIAGQLVGIQRYGFDRDYINKRNSYVESVTREDVNRVAKRLLDSSRLFWVIVGKPEGLESTPEPATP